MGTPQPAPLHVANGLSQVSLHLCTWGSQQKQPVSISDGGYLATTWMDEVGRRVRSWFELEQVEKHRVAMENGRLV